MAKISKYGGLWDPDVHPLDIERACIRKGGKWKDAKGHEYGMGLFHHYTALEAILWPDEYRNRWTDWTLNLLLNERICVFGGCKDCVSENTRIPNPITGDQPTVRELIDSKTEPLVMTLAGPKKASVPFFRGEGPLLEITLSNGCSFVCSQRHYVLTSEGFEPAESLYPGQAIYSVAPMSQGSILESSPSIRVSDGLRWFGKVPDYPRNYQNEPCFCGEPPRSEEGIFRFSSPSQAGALGHILRRCETDALGNGSRRNRLYPVSSHPSNEDFCFPGTFSERGDQCHSFLRSCEQLLGPFQRPLRYGKSSDLRQAFGVLNPYSCRTRTRYVGSCIDYGATIATVQRIKNAGRGKFYDLTVPDACHYFSEGAIHHNSGKTRRASKWALMDYWCFPDNTLTIMTSTTNRGLELRVWGDIKSLWDRAHSKFPWLEGNPSDSKHGIFTDSLDEGDTVRDMRRGILGIPTMTSEGAYDGSALAEFAGIKQARRRLIGDEMQYISCDYLKVMFAMDAGDFKGAFLGNMIAENGKALDRIAEPEGGWGSEGEITKSTQWRNKYGGVTLNLVGIDSPNLDPATKNKFPGMLTQDSIDRAAKLPGAKDSVEWWSQIMGVRKLGVVSDRPFTVNDVKNNGGFKDVIWTASPKKLLAIDAGYGGDDCVKTYCEWGEEVGGTMVLAFKEQGVYPIAISSPITPEDQIAIAAKDDCDKYGVPYENVFIEAGMRATLAVSMGRILSPSINAINFGGTATDRPVSNDLFVFDEKTQQRRLKTCFEHYSKFVTELVFAVRDLVMCGQARSFPMPAAEEFQKRKWRFVYNDRYEIETKIEYKERNGGKSPNESDSIMIAVEGARRLGFQIEKAADINQSEPEQEDWLEKELGSMREFARKQELSYES